METVIELRSDENIYERVLGYTPKSWNLPVNCVYLVAHVKEDHRSAAVRNAPGGLIKNATYKQGDLFYPTPKKLFKGHPDLTVFDFYELGGLSGQQGTFEAVRAVKTGVLENHAPREISVQITFGLSWFDPNAFVEKFKGRPYLSREDFKQEVSTVIGGAAENYLGEIVAQNNGTIPSEGREKIDEKFKQKLNGDDFIDLNGNNGILSGYGVMVDSVHIKLLEDRKFEATESAVMTAKYLSENAADANKK